MILASSEKLFSQDGILIKGRSGVGRAAIKRRVAARIKISDNA
ncbi:MAG: hypothetical protein ACFNUU_10560 [Campylobacter sp.]